MVKQHGLLTLVIFGNDIGSADERKNCGVEDVQVQFNLLFFSSVRFERKTKEGS